MLEAMESLVREDPLWNSNLKTDEHAVNLLNEIIQDGRIYLTLSEMMNLYRMVLRANAVEGEMAELGVCRGGSAKLIAEAMDKSKKLFLFDSFEGMPEMTPGLDQVNIGDMAYPIHDVAYFLKNYSQIQLIKDFYPP
jgi:predicted O-methyltransferase YrrM